MWYMIFSAMLSIHVENLNGYTYVTKTRYSRKNMNRWVYITLYGPWCKLAEAKVKRIK